MIRPAFQFYPEAWTSDTGLRRCSWGARGAWIAVLCLMHDSEEYGVLRWPLKEIAATIGAPVALLRELVDKDVLRGCDGAHDGYTYRPRHAGKEGDPVVLVEAGPGACWWSRRMVRDEYRRKHSGGATRFGPGGVVPEKSTPSGRQGGPQGVEPRQRAGNGARSLSLGSIGNGLQDMHGKPVDNFPETSKPMGDKSPGKPETEKPGKGWHLRPEGVQAMGQFLGMQARAGESLRDYKDRLFAAEWGH